MSSGENIPPPGDLPGRNDWDGAAYQARIDARAAQGEQLHGEADFVERWWAETGANQPGTVLDAGCGTGRVAIELARRGWSAVGVDVDVSMLAAAADRAPDLAWLAHDLVDGGFDLGRRFDLVLLAGNVPLFTPAGTVPQLVAGAARHLDAEGAMICGFSLQRGVEVDEFDDAATAAGLVLDRRFATWDGDPFGPGADYQLSIHRRAPRPA
jgi:SAM-dependent methyltransferase